MTTGTLDGVTTEVVEMTPATAHHLLAGNTHNRKLNPTKVKMYTEAIQRGEWVFNGDAIRVDRHGVLLDGQHRLEAVIKAEKSIMVVLVTGLDPEAQETVDIGRKRTTSDMLRLRGELNSATLAGSLNLLFSYKTHGILYSGASSLTATPQQLMKFLDQYPEVRNYLYTPHSSTIKKLLTPSIAAALYYLFATVDEDDAFKFFELLATGNGLALGNPIYALRERLMREERKAQGRISATVRAALTVKAFNFWREGRQVQTLKWTGGGGRGEAFPRVKEATLVPDIDLY